MPDIPDFPTSHFPASDLPIPEFSLFDWGWTASTEPFAETDSLDHIVGRIVVQQRDLWATVSAAGDLLADIRGRLRNEPPENLPVVGDFVVLAPRAGEGRATIQTVLPRRTSLQRKVAGRESRPQVIAANVDTVFVAVPLDMPVNHRLIERQLVVVWESGATPVVVGTKADIDHEEVGRNQLLAVSAEVVLISAQTNSGLDGLARWLSCGQTVALIGPSGAGKSTLTNALLGSHQMVTNKHGRATGKVDIQPPIGNWSNFQAAQC
jgi:ribosome biogenesis GTPase / thiamine phosphate phosphatase